jgi:hypothetical protein
MHGSKNSIYNCIRAAETLQKEFSTLRYLPEMEARLPTQQWLAARGATLFSSNPHFHSIGLSFFYLPLLELTHWQVQNDIHLILATISRLHRVLFSIQKRSTSLFSN